MSMKAIYYKVLLLGFCCFLGANTLSAQKATEYFDPETDPVATLVNGKLRLIVSEEVLVRSVRMTLARIGLIENIDRQYLEGHWFLILESRHALNFEQAVYVALRLKPDGQGNYFAEHYWDACTGEACSGCMFDQAAQRCFCKYDKPGAPGENGFCMHTVSDDPLLKKVPLKPD